MMFYGRISDVYMGVITLVVTLILFKFMNATAGDAYRIGSARLGGFNGIPAFPILNVPGDPSMQIYGTGLYYVVVVCLLGCYLIARWILASAFGRTLIGIRENEARIELLGYNAPAYKTAIFSLTAAMAGLAGCLFANWAEIVTPSRVQPRPVGRGDHLGHRRRPGHAARPDDRRGRAGHRSSCCSASRPLIDNSLVLGAILMLVVLLLPRGLVPTLRRLARAPRPGARSPAARAGPRARAVAASRRRTPMQ